MGPNRLRIRAVFLCLAALTALITLIAAARAQAPSAEDSPFWSASSASSSASTEIPGQHYIRDVSPDEVHAQSFRLIRFDLWIPDDVPSLSGIYVFTDTAPWTMWPRYVNNKLVPSAPLPQRMRDAARAADYWKKFAVDHRMGILNITFDGTSWWKAENGTGAALLFALDDMARFARRSEVGRVPLVLTGWFGYSFVQWRPERTAAFIFRGYDTGTQPLVPPSEAIRKIPALFLECPSKAELNGTPGDPDKGNRAIWQAGRSQGAPWGFVPESATTGITALMQKFLDAVLPARLGLSQEGGLGSEAAPWVADLGTGTVRPTGQENDLECAWLPNEETAKAWLTAVPPPTPATSATSATSAATP